MISFPQSLSPLWGRIMFLRITEGHRAGFRQRWERGNIGKSKAPLVRGFFITSVCPFPRMEYFNGLSVWHYEWVYLSALTFIPLFYDDKFFSPTFTGKNIFFHVLYPFDIYHLPQT